MHCVWWGEDLTEWSFTNLKGSWLKQLQQFQWEILRAKPWQVSTPVYTAYCCYLYMELLHLELSWCPEMQLFSWSSWWLHGGILDPALAWLYSSFRAAISNRSTSSRSHCLQRRLSENPVCSCQQNLSFLEFLSLLGLAQAHLNQAGLHAVLALSSA